MVFNTNDIIICQNSDEIKHFVFECDIFVRGYRNQSDEHYIRLLADYYKSEHILDKVVYIPIENEFIMCHHQR